MFPVGFEQLADGLEAGAYTSGLEGGLVGGLRALQATERDVAPDRRPGRLRAASGPLAGRGR